MGIVTTVVLVVGVPLILLAGLTMLGERHRSERWSVVALAGVFFPVTWTAWNLRDGGLPGGGERERAEGRS